MTKYIDISKANRQWLEEKEEKEWKNDKKNFKD
jgi:hypothetical protein